MHRRKNRLHPRFPFCDLLVELLQLIKNLFQSEADALSLSAILNQKGAWPLTALNLCDDIFNLLPLRNPFATHHEGNNGHQANNQAHNQPTHRA